SVVLLVELRHVGPHQRGEKTPALRPIGQVGTENRRPGSAIAIAVPADPFWIRRVFALFRYRKQLWGIALRAQGGRRPEYGSGKTQCARCRTDRGRNARSWGDLRGLTQHQDYSNKKISRHRTEPPCKKIILAQSSEPVLVTGAYRRTRQPEIA